MRITGVRAYPLNLKVSPEFVIATSLGVHDRSSYVLVAIESDEGLVGWGEATVVPIWSGETQAGTLSLVRNLFAPLLIGADPFDIEGIMSRIDASVVQNPFSKASIEMALLDLIGKKLRLPLHAWLGGDVHPHKIPIKFSIGMREPEETARIAAEKVAEGFRAIKVKVGHDLAKDLLRVRLVREAIGPDVRLNLDVNGGWNARQAIRNIPRFLGYNLEYVEQPTPRENIEDLAKVRAAVDVPIMADESAFTVAQALRVLRLEAADIISVYPGKNGGLLKSRLICKMAAEAGVACHLGSNLEWDIATAAMCQLGVSTANSGIPDHPPDILGPLYYRVRLPGNPVLFKGGHVHLPEGPGLGLAIDEQAIAELCAAQSETPRARPAGKGGAGAEVLEHLGAAR